MPAPAPLLPWGTKKKSWGSAGAKWGMKLSPAPRPEKRRRPFHRKPKPQDENQANITMSTFKFSPAPKSGGGYSTRAVFGAILQESTLTAAAAAEAGITAEKVEIVIKSVLNGILKAGADSGYSNELYGLLRFRPTSGGSADDPAAFNTAEDINADIALSFTSDAIAAWRPTLTLDNQGLVGKITPVISTIMNRKNRADNEYTPGDMIELIGDNLRFDESDTEQGVFFSPASGPDVRATVYGRNEPSMVVALVPTGLTGPQTVRIAAFINGSVRSFTYTDPITPSA